MKSTYSLLIIILTLISLSPITVLSDFVTEDGIKVQFFKQKSKKPIPQKLFTDNNTNENKFEEYMEINGTIRTKEPITKIELKGKFEDNQEDLIYRLSIVNKRTKESVFIKDSVTFGLGDKKYSFDLSSSIRDTGDYEIILERLNSWMMKNILTLTYYYHQ
jgi:hypothetical protein